MMRIIRKRQVVTVFRHLLRSQVWSGRARREAPAEPQRWFRLPSINPRVADHELGVCPHCRDGQSALQRTIARVWDLNCFC